MLGNLTLAMIAATMIIVVTMQITVSLIPIAAMERRRVGKLTILKLAMIVATMSRVVIGHMTVSFIPIAAMDIRRVIACTMSWFTVMAVLGIIRAKDCNLKPFLAGGR